MEKNLYIDASHPNETRVVLKSNGNIEDYEYEGIKNTLIKNNIYLGKVSRVEPSLQAAFVDFGRERHGFLSFNDIQSDYYQIPQSDLEKIKREEEEEREKLQKESEQQEEKNLNEGNPVNSGEFNGKDIRVVGKHHYIAKHAHGTAIWYYRSGKKMTARTFRDGKLEGPMVSWYEDGKNKYAVNYTDNKKNGEAKGWHKNEKEMFVIEYDHGIKHGKETWYWDTGAKKFEYTWYQGLSLIHI